MRIPLMFIYIDIDNDEPTVKSIFDEVNEE